MVRWLSCSPIQSVIYADLDTRVLGTFGTPCVLCDLVFTTSIDSVGQAPAATVVICSLLSCVHSLTRVLDNQCAVWAEAPSEDATTSHIRGEQGV